MNNHFAIAAHLYESNGHDFKDLLGWHLCYGIVLCTPNYFGLGFFADRANPRLPIRAENSDTLHVTMCAGDMRGALQQFANDFEYIAFQREFKNSPRLRIYSMDKFITNLYN